MKKLIDEKAAILADFIRDLNVDFVLRDVMESYGHMGATITDAILQAGMNYENVVIPRTTKLKKLYPEAKTTTGFLRVLERIDPSELLEFKKGSKKLTWIVEATKFFVERCVETEEDLSTWLKDENNIKALRKLNGVGPKTSDYFKILVGMNSGAVDVHVTDFLSWAKIYETDYQVKKAILEQAADILKYSRNSLDHSIWWYVVEKKKHNLKLSKKKGKFKEQESSDENKQIPLVERWAMDKNPVGFTED